MTYRRIRQIGGLDEGRKSLEEGKSVNSKSFLTTKFALPATGVNHITGSIENASRSLLRRSLKFEGEYDFDKANEEFKEVLDKLQVMNAKIQKVKTSF